MKGKAEGTPEDYDSLDHEQVAKVESKIMKMNVLDKEMKGLLRS